MRLYLLNQSVISGFRTVYAFLLSSSSVFFAIVTVIANNPVYSILFLIGLFISISLYLMTLGLTFVGISYLLVYVGAISILFLFIMMLINVRVSELLTEGLNSAALGTITVLTLSSNLGDVLPYYLQISDAFSNYFTYIKTAIVNFLSEISGPLTNALHLLYIKLLDIGSVNGLSWDGFLVDINHISSIGNILYSNLFILLILVSLVLLLAMVGTIVITLKQGSNLKQMYLQSSLWEVFNSFLDCINCFDVNSSSDIATQAEQAIPPAGTPDVIITKTTTITETASAVPSDSVNPTDPKSGK